MFFYYLGKIWKWKNQTFHDVNVYNHIIEENEKFQWSYGDALGLRTLFILAQTSSFSSVHPPNSTRIYLKELHPFYECQKKGIRKMDVLLSNKSGLRTMRLGHIFIMYFQIYYNGTSNIFYTVKIQQKITIINFIEFNLKNIEMLDWLFNFPPQKNRNCIENMRDLKKWFEYVPNTLYELTSSVQNTSFPHR